jgi:TPR repeat protein/AcrR family transcriptional regulator
MSERAADTVETQLESPVLESPMRVRNPARAAILDAARKVATREGIEGTSLGLVADEAGVARAAVYAQFRSKNDLFLSIVADDLNLLAQTMREAQGLPPYKPATPSKIVRFDSAQMEAFRNERETHGADAAKEAEPAQMSAPEATEPANEEGTDTPFASLSSDMVRIGPAPGQAPQPAPEDTQATDVGPENHFGMSPAAEPADAPADAGDEMPEIAAPVTDDEPVAEEPHFESAKPLEKKLPTINERIRLVGKRSIATTELKDTLKKLSPAHSSESDAATDTISKLQETVGKFEGGMAEKLERRIQVLERAIATLEQRHDKADQMNAQAAGTVHDALNKLIGRIDDSEKRLRDSMVKMMSEVRDAARRVDVIEFGKQAAAAEAAEHVPAFGVTAEEFASLEDEAQKTEAPRDLRNHNDDADEDHDTADVEPGEMKEPEPRTYLYTARRSAQSAAMLAEEAVAGELLRKSKRTKMMLAGVGALVVTLVVAGVILKRVSGVPSAAASQVTQTMATTHMHKHVALMPKHLMLASLQAKPAGVAPLDKLSALANAGKPDAQLMVGLKYLSGDGVPKNDTEAAKWIARAATQGNPVAEYWFGSLYQRGRGVAADPAQAIVWFDKSAAQGNRKAMHNLAIAYADGRGVAKDFMVAARWFTQAAQLGYVDSQFNLAVLYERGDGVPQSLLDAYKWYSIAAAQGDTESKARIDAIATQLSADDLAAAQKAAQAFKPSNMQSAANEIPKEALIIAQP